MKRKILAIDDEPGVLELVRYNLEESGFDVDTASDGVEGLKKAQDSLPDLLLLDLMLPGIDGLDICRILRANPKTAGIPIIMLTAKASEIDRVVGLELGADDYVTKPFSPRELLLRIKKRLEQMAAAPETPKELFHAGNLAVDVPRHIVSFKGRRINLTAIEFKLLVILIQRVGRVQSREQLLRDVWEYDTLIDTRTVDTHMRRLRDKLGPASRYLDTVRGVGYRFLDEAP